MFRKFLPASKPSANSLQSDSDSHAPYGPDSGEETISQEASVTASQPPVCGGAGVSGDPSAAGRPCLMALTQPASGGSRTDSSPTETASDANRLLLDNSAAAAKRGGELGDSSSATDGAAAGSNGIGDMVARIAQIRTAAVAGGNGDLEEPDAARVNSRSRDFRDMSLEPLQKAKNANLDEILARSGGTNADSDPDDSASESTVSGEAKPSEGEADDGEKVTGEAGGERESENDAGADGDAGDKAEVNDAEEGETENEVTGQGVQGSSSNVVMVSGVDEETVKSPETGANDDEEEEQQEEGGSQVEVGGVKPASGKGEIASANDNDDGRRPLVASVSGSAATSHEPSSPSNASQESQESQESSDTSLGVADLEVVGVPQLTEIDRTSGDVRLTLDQYAGCKPHLHLHTHPLTHTRAHACNHNHPNSAPFPYHPSAEFVALCSSRRPPSPSALLTTHTLASAHLPPSPIRPFPLMRAVGAVNSKSYLRFGFVSARIKVPPVYSGSVITTLYLTSKLPGRHDEIDFELIGSESPSGIRIHTNYYANGKGGHEEQMQPWFDPTSEFHTYSVRWSPEAIVWYVDERPIRETRFNPHNPAVGVVSPLRVCASVWSADWAMPPMDWSYGPFTAQYQEFNFSSNHSHAKSSPTSSSSSSSSDVEKELGEEGLSAQERADMQRVKNAKRDGNKTEGDKKDGEGGESEGKVGNTLGEADTAAAPKNADAPMSGAAPKNADAPKSAAAPKIAAAPKSAAAPKNDTVPKGAMVNKGK
ncbi:unnamed protein product [Closterium sp. NIES-64]|nr:unnamed protein product [Closterium sp. NIES-64]